MNLVTAMKGHLLSSAAPAPTSMSWNSYILHLIYFIVDNNDNNIIIIIIIVIIIIILLLL